MDEAAVVQQREQPADIRHHAAAGCEEGEQGGGGAVWTVWCEAAVSACAAGGGLVLERGACSKRGLSRVPP